MARLTDAIISGAYTRNLDRPMLDLKYGGQHGWSPNLSEWVSNAAYVSRPLITILLEAPRMFSVMPDSQKWIASLKALFEVHAKSVDGLTQTLSVDTDTHPVGGAGEVQTEVTNVTREKSSVKFSWTEKYGLPISTLLSYWIRYGMMDPETKFALLGTMNKSEVKDLLPDWYSATCLFIEPDPLHKKVVKSWLVTNMFPLSSGDLTSKRDLTSGQEILNLDIEFASLSQVGIGINKFAQSILDNINITRADPFMSGIKAADKISADVSAQNSTGYKSWAETVGRTAVTSV